MRSVVLFILFLLLFFTGGAMAGDEIRINQALANGGNVHLASGVYNLEGPVIIHSNTVLSGEPDTILRVSSSSSQWFTGQTGVICNPSESLQNVEICGFCIDGNIGNLPRSFDSTTGHDRDCEKLFILGGWSSQFANNLKIHDMKLYNAFSDGAYVYFANNVQFYNNIISNCQHEGFFFSCVTNGLIYNNQIAGITSDCGRLDNCQNCKIYNNLFFSYNGNSYGAFKHGENGLQIGNAGSSHGYDASNKPLYTANIEVYGNSFADPGRQAIWYHAGENVFIHDNRFVDASGLETEGFSFDNSPSLETSERVFSSIFDILKMDYNFRYPDISQDLKGNVQVLSYSNYSLVKVQGEDLTAVKVSYEGKQVMHYLEKGFWVGELHHQGDRVFLPGSFQKGALKVTCISSQGYQEVTDFEVIEKQEEQGSINPDVVPFVGTLTICGIAIFRNLRRMIK